MLAAFAHDAKRFMLSHRVAVELAPLQLYSCALIFSPQNCHIRKAFEQHIPSWIEQSPRVPCTWGRSVLCLEKHSDFVLSVAFSGDGKLLASGSRDTTIRFWDPSTGEALGVLEGHSGSVYSVAFSSGGNKLLASASDDTTVRLWDVSTGETLRVFEGHLDAVYSIAFSSTNDNMLASSSLDTTIRLWDPSTGDALGVLQGHSGVVSSIAFSPDGTKLASAARDGTIHLWDIQTREARVVVDRHGAGEIAFSADGLLALGLKSSVELWDPVTGENRCVLKGHRTLGLTFSTDGRMLASRAGRSPFSKILLWDTVTGKQLGMFGEDHDSVFDLAFSADGLLASAGDSVRLWDPYVECPPVVGHTRAVTAVAFSAGGQFLASAARNEQEKTIRVWDSLTGQPRIVLKGYDVITSIAFSGDGKLLAAASGQNTVRLWDPSLGQALGQYNGPPRNGTHFALSFDGRLLASGTDSQNILIWDTSTGRSHRVPLEPMWGSMSPILLAFSADCKMLAVWAMSDVVRIWNLSEDGSPEDAYRVLESNFTLSRSLAFSPDGSLLAASVSEGNNLLVWDAKTTRLRHKIHALSLKFCDLYFLSCGTRIFTAGGIVDLEQHDPSDAAVQREPYHGIFVRKGWIVSVTGERILQLPAEYRGGSQIDLYRNRIAIATSTGELAVMEINLDAVPRGKKIASSETSRE